jgi:hypothetical protein
MRKGTAREVVALKKKKVLVMYITLGSNNVSTKMEVA